MGLKWKNAHREEDPIAESETWAKWMRERWGVGRMARREEANKDSTPIGVGMQTRDCRDLGGIANHPEGDQN
jgi:hypothetical protein